MPISGNGANANNLDAAFKQFYADGIEDLCFTDRPLFGLMPKMEGWEGANQATRAWHIPLKFARPPAISANFSVAQNRAANVSSKVVAWELLTAPMFAFIQIDNESMLRSEGNEGAFVEIKSLEVDGIIENLSNRLHHYMYGDGTGVIAQVGNSTQMPSFSVSTCYLLNSEDAVKISPGDELTLAATPTGTELAFGTNNHGLYVIGVNMDAGTFTVGTLAGVACNLNDAADGIPTIATSGYICHRGDRGAVMAGFQQWIPNFATGIATNDSLFNVNRSQLVDFLAGSRFDSSSYPIEEGLVRGTNVVAKKGGKIEQLFVNHKHYSDLVTSLSAKGIVNFLDIRPTDMPNIGFEGVKIIGAKGEVDVIPDYACPSTLAAGFRLSEWYLGSIGDPVRVNNADGLEFLRLASANGLEGRFVSYSNMVPRNPRDAINLTLPM